MSMSSYLQGRYIGFITHFVFVLSTGSGSLGLGDWLRWNLGAKKLRNDGEAEISQCFNTYWSVRRLCFWLCDRQSPLQAECQELLEHLSLAAAALPSQEHLISAPLALYSATTAQATAILLSSTLTLGKRDNSDGDYYY